MLSFDEPTHTYRWDGQVMPSVSQLLASSGLKPEARYTPGSAERGSEVHRLTELFDLEFLQLGEAGEYEGYLIAWASFVKQTGWKSTAIEARVANPHLWLAGTIDRIGTMNGETWKLDIKSGAKARWHGYQLAAYNLITQSMDKRACVYITAEGKFTLCPWQDDMDHVRVLEALK